jgi:hypothetical protein
MDLAVKDFLKSFLRIATAILLVLVVVAIAAWTIRSYPTDRESRTNAAQPTFFF